MSSASHPRQLKQCPNCGRYVPLSITQCPDCREPFRALPPSTRHAAPRKGSQFRRGLLYMLLAAVIQYFSGGYSSLELPFPIHPAVQEYLAPLLFLSGLGLIVYGFFSSSRA